MTYTRHGHHIDGTERPEGLPPPIARCGGPAICGMCSHDLAQAMLNTALDIPTRAGREGDKQSLPTASDAPIAHHLVMEDLEERLRIGIERYGQPLQAHNGRDSLRDAYEEALDLCVYLRNAIYERDNPQ